jgi:hypothetical protein
MGTLADLFGSRPAVPPWQGLNLGQEQQTAAANNLEIAPEASKLANLTEQQLLSMLKTAIPNWDQISGTASSNIESFLKGEIPTDVSQAVQSSAASESLFGGYGGTGMSRNLTARDLGLTSLNLTEKGLSQAESWQAASERLLAPAANVYTSMFVTPGEQAGFDVNERNLKFAHDYLQNQIAAMPNPTLPVGAIEGILGGGRGQPTGGTSVPGASNSGMDQTGISSSDWGLTSPQTDISIGGAATDASLLSGGGTGAVGGWDLGSSLAGAEALA